MGVNIKDVAYRAGVSPSTVSRVIADHPRISSETKERVLAVMKELDYHPNAIARSLVKKSSETLGILIPNNIEEFFNPFFPEVLRGITQVAQAEGYDLFLSTSLNHLNDKERTEKIIRSKRIDGLIILTSKENDPLFEVLERLRFPSVLIGRPPVTQESLLWVNNDNVKASFEATQHLAELGHKRIGFIGGSHDFIVTQDRLKGYHQALDAVGIPFDPRLIIAAEFIEEGGYLGMLRLLALSDRPSAIVASDDVLAFGAMRAAGEMGYRIPEDLAIVGFNDIPLAKLSNPPLTTVSVNILELGQKAAGMLIDQIQSPEEKQQSAIIGHELVIRRSCGAWNPAFPYQPAMRDR